MDLMNGALTWVFVIVVVLLFFGVTIFVHELGHFLIARRRGMKVERFSIGFGPALWKKTVRDVEYRVGVFPFGGYVLLPQMSTTEALEGKSSVGAESLPPAKPLSKILVSFAGPIMNLVLALMLACIIWVVGLPMPVNPSVVGWVEPGSSEEKMGIRAGDRIVQINNRNVKTWMEILRAVAISREPNATLVIERNGQRREYQLKAEANPALGVKTINLYSQGRPYTRKVQPGSPAEQGGVKPGDQFLSVEGVPVTRTQELIDHIGKQADKPTELRVMRNGKVETLQVVPRIYPNEKAARIGVELGEQLEYEVLRPGPSPWQQFRDVFQLMGDTVYALVHSKQTGVGASSLSGPIGILGMLWHELTYGGLRRALWFAVLLNINLATINLLPIPVLDGGHILFTMIEAIRRKPLNARLIHATSVVFAVLLITFMLYVTFFDIQRLTFGRVKIGSKQPTHVSVPAKEPTVTP